MRVAVIYDDKDVYVEFTPEKFLALLNKYFEKYGSIDAAMREIIEELKRETQRK